MFYVIYSQKGSVEVWKSFKQCIYIAMIIGNWRFKDEILTSCIAHPPEAFDISNINVHGIQERIEPL